ncbi:arginase [Leifsonia xyli subsp. cynodontis DSM 46306]|uniref:Arginase n=1 Tax=Leifsonia xyli subsp. cynodontis DSM 46306 TaxID=1389489 RepID=U3P6X8_LEIXC|nr:arginase [Leifsonia xyli subsp. cynodontis DSM 46306]
MAKSGIRVVEPGDFDDPDTLVRAVAASGATSVYLHIDLDVLDPAVVDGIWSPEPFGVTTEQLCDAIRALRARFELAGAAVTEFAPESPEAAVRDLPVILRVLGALTGPVPGPRTPDAPVAPVSPDAPSSTASGPQRLSTDAP